MRFGRRRGDPLILPFPGHATATTLVLLGRVLARPVDGLRVIASFRTAELAGVAVTVDPDGPSGTSDAEGYFRIEMPRDHREGWIEIPVRAGGHRSLLPVLVPRHDAGFGIITDIDDTVLHTGAWSHLRNLWTTLRGTIESRQVFPDAVGLLSRLAEDGRNPVFYVSASPWNLLVFLTTLFDRANLPRGPLFLRDWGRRGRGLASGSRAGHKAQAIDTILAANPGMGFVLIGDTGQQDADIYLQAARRHPGRIRHVILRRAGPGGDPAVAGFAALGIAADVVASFAEIALP